MKKIFLSLIFSLIIPNVSLAETLKFVHFSDIHIDTKSKNSSSGRLYSSSSTLLKSAIREVNEMKNVDFIVFSGDLVNKPTDENFNEFLDISKGLKTPYYTAIGNHDGRKILTQKAHYYSTEPKKDFVFIFLDSNLPVSANGYFGKKQLNWLDNELYKYKNKKVILIQHHPAIEPFKSKSHFLLNANDYLKIINCHKNVIAVLSGHYHASKITKKDNVLHISTPSLIQYPNAFRVIKIETKKDGITIDIKTKQSNLMKLVKKSKNMTKSAPLLEGKPEDKDIRINLFSE